MDESANLFYFVHLFSQLCESFLDKNAAVPLATIQCKKFVNMNYSILLREERYACKEDLDKESKNAPS